MSQRRPEGSRAAEARILRWIADDEWMMTALEAVRGLDLPDWWIVAGFVRAKVWDVLHGHGRRTLPGDLDVVFFDRQRPASEDRRLEAQLREVAPEYPWEVYNQAHTHTFNGDAPYGSSVDAFSRWAETVSTVGVSLGRDRRLVLAAPHGVQDLIELVVRPTPHPDAQPDVFAQRLKTKAWRRHWPRATVIES